MPISVFIFLLIELIFVSYIDVTKRKIPNMWVLINLFFAIIIFFLIPTYKFSFSLFLFPLSFLIVGFALFMLKIMGGGDSKFLFSMFLLIPTALHEQYFLCLAYMTVFVGFTLFIINIARNHKKIRLAIKYKDIGRIKNVFGKKFTFAPVILFAWIWFGWIIRNNFN